MTTDPPENAPESAPESATDTAPDTTPDSAAAILDSGLETVAGGDAGRVADGPLMDPAMDAAMDGAMDEDAPVSIALAEPADAEELGKLTQELLTFYGLPSSYQPTYIAYAIEKHGFAEGSGLKILVARRRGTVTGFLAFAETFTLTTCRPGIFIQDLFVGRAYRRSGAGRALMDVLIRHAAKRGVAQIDWTADLWNDGAARFYERLGPLLKSEKIYYRLPHQALANYLKRHPA